MTSAKKKIFSVLLVVLLLAATLSTMSACNIRKWKEGESVHKDGVYYTVYVSGHYAVAHGFDKVEGKSTYEIPSYVRYKLIKFPVKQFVETYYADNRVVLESDIITELVVPKTVEKVEFRNYGQATNLQKITVSKDNAHLLSVDGVLFTKDKSELIFFPPAKEDGTLSIPSETVKINDYLSYKSNLSAIEVADGNAMYSAQDGVLFTADGSEMLCYPLNKKSETYLIPQTLSVLGTWHFERNEYLKRLEVEQGNTTFSAYNGDLYSADGSILLYRPNEDVRYLELPDGVTIIGYGTLNRVRYLYVPKSLQRVVFDAYYRYDDENATNPIGDIKYVYCESNELPICLRYTKFTGSVSFSVSREQFQAEIERARSEGLL